VCLRLFSIVDGVTATSGGVLFTGDLNNDFLALDAKTGGPLLLQHQRQHRWRRDLLFARKQYAAATSGTVSAFFGGAGGHHLRPSLIPQANELGETHIAGSPLGLG
jgi:hypothetical protein